VENTCLTQLILANRLNGNPAGAVTQRPTAWQRTVFSQAFFAKTSASLVRGGLRGEVKTAKNNPTVFFATCARLIVKMTVEQSLPGNLSIKDWQMMKEV
jgi:hypothetical protein